MRNRYRNVILLLITLLLNIVFTQKMVHQYFYENYVQALIYVGLNVILFPFAYFVYKYDLNNESVKKDE